MGTTPVFQLPYPEAADPADVPLDMRELAERLEAFDLRAGEELGHWQITAPVVTAVTVEASATTVVSSPAITCDGKLVLFEFFAPHVANNAAGAYTFLALFDGSIVSGRIAAIQAQAAGGGGPVYGAYRGAPSAGSHTFSIRAYVSGGSSTIFGAAGGPGGYMPAYLRITRAKSS